MSAPNTYHEALEHLIVNALKEDIGQGDVSTLSCIPADARGTACLKVKQAGILAGVRVAESIFRFVDPDFHFTSIKSDADFVESGDIAFEVEARVHTILSCERLVLNCMQRMSGIATLTRRFIDEIEGTQAKLLDTRKTTPNFRLLEKEAVRIGGGHNHRFGLYDMIMLKDNHIDYCGGLEPAIQKAIEYKSQFHPEIAIEVETRSLEDVAKVLRIGGIDRIMFDNFSSQNISEAVKMVAGRFETEASGGITLDNIREFALTGVDYISSGAIIHQATSLDMSLKATII